MATFWEIAARSVSNLFSLYFVYFNFKPVNLRNQSFNVNNSILHTNVSDSLSILYSNVDCLTQSKKLELEYLLSNKKVDIVALTEIYPKKQLI